MLSLTCLHFPFEGDFTNEFGLLITAKINAPPTLGIVRLFDLTHPTGDRTKDTSGSVPPATLFSNNEFTGPWGIQGRNFRPRIFFPAASPQVVAVYNQCYTLLDLQRPDICVKRTYLPPETKALQVARSWNTITHTIPLVYSTAGGLHYALVDTRVPDSAQQGTRISPRRYDIFDVGQISVEAIANRSTDLRVTAVAGRDSQLAQFAYCQEYRKPTSLLSLSCKEKAIDIITSFNGWWEIITYRQSILLLDFTKSPDVAGKPVFTPTSHPPNFITHKAARETHLPGSWFTAKVPQFRNFVKCEFAEPGSHLPRHFSAVGKTEGSEYVLFRVNIRALGEGKNIAHAISVVPSDSAGLLDWSRMDEVVSWRDRIWLPTVPTVELESSAGYIYPTPIGERSEKDGDEDISADGDEVSDGDAVKRVWVTYESLEGMTESKRQEGYVISSRRAKSLFAGRDDDYWPWDLLLFLANRMKMVLESGKLKCTEANGRSELLDYIEDWTKLFKISLAEEVQMKDVIRSCCDVAYISLEFDGKVRLFKDASLGCLAFALRSLDQEQKDGSTFNEFLSILFGGSIASPIHLPVFATRHIEHPEIYHFSANTSKRLNAPIKRRRHSSTAVLSTSATPPINSHTLPEHEKFLHKSIALTSSTILLATEDWGDKPTVLPGTLDMYVPRSRCDSTWFDSEGNLRKTAFESAEIRYPICVPSKSIDAYWRVDQWSAGQNLEHCLILFVRPFQFAAMSTRLDHASFVIVPLEDEGTAYTFTRECIRQWAENFECPFIYCLDDNIEDLFTVDNTIQETLRKQDWLSVFHMLAVHASTPGWENVGVWGMQRWDGRSHNKRSEIAWVQRHCQCFVLLNIAALQEKGIHYIRKDREDDWQRKALGAALDEMGPLEDYLLNFCCEGNGLKVLQNQFYMFRKAERIGKGNEAEWNYVTFQGQA